MNLWIRVCFVNSCSFQNSASQLLHLNFFSLNGVFNTVFTIESNVKSVFATGMASLVALSTFVDFFSISNSFFVAVFLIFFVWMSGIFLGAAESVCIGDLSAVNSVWGATFSLNFFVADISGSTFPFLTMDVSACELVFSFKFDTTVVSAFCFSFFGLFLANNFDFATGITVVCVTSLTLRCCFFAATTESFGTFSSWFFDLSVSSFISDGLLSMGRLSNELLSDRTLLPTALASCDEFSDDSDVFFFFRRPCCAFCNSSKKAFFFNVAFGFRFPITSVFVKVL